MLVYPKPSRLMVVPPHRMKVVSTQARPISRRSKHSRDLVRSRTRTLKRLPRTPTQEKVEERTPTMKLQRSRTSSSVRVQSWPHSTVPFQSVEFMGHRTGTAATAGTIYRPQLQLLFRLVKPINLTALTKTSTLKDLCELSRGF